MNKLSKGLICSTIFHLMMLIIFTQPFSQAPLPMIIKKNPGKPIQARLYFSSVAKYSSFAFDTVQATIIKKAPKNETKSETQTVKRIPLKRESTTQAKILPKQPNNKNC
ncbi:MULTISPECIES: hypothetical protein [unclassified Colwellia]|uniref:hypothetical protein n=1 Tax=unclassified Colwellia TaxID=196834 RepID=UPI0015F6BB9B|nr:MULTISPECIES: hypothetical protein [unclassified Colwellia]MBA6232123.1 hypothetical protein [Colwellia sp. MB02u-7]MBA6237179.1 hypothetical protein [Colwellia sp. MB02u-11]MBA6257389.1 hypothetical protein [Colwellia sp. MB3u-28]MBA6260461.1 hypothetical protein [Colwellia sp. MB3u-41]MBA6301557.1 hypothetical protein [Colwellia sp. MB3u-22]